MAHNKKRKKIRGSVNVVTSCISTTLVLVLLGSVVFFVHIARNFSNNIKENFAISLLLDDEISKDQIKAFQDRIEKGRRSAANAHPKGEVAFLRRGTLRVNLRSFELPLHR